MNSIFIVQLVGVVGLLVGLGFFISVALSVRRTMREMESTLHSVCGEILGLVPRVYSALDRFERTGEEIGQTAASSTVLLDRINGRTGSSALLDGAARILPSTVALIRIIQPLLRRRSAGRRGEA